MTNVTHLQMSMFGDGGAPGRLTCPLCRFLARTSLASVRAAWGMERGAAFVDALARLDLTSRAAFEPEETHLFDDTPETYASAWLEAFVHFLDVAPTEVLDAVPASFLAAFLRAGGAALGPEAAERGREAVEALQAAAEARA